MQKVAKSFIKGRGEGGFDNFLDMMPKAQATKEKKYNKRDCQNLKLLGIRGHNQQNEEATYGMRENIYKS